MDPERRIVGDVSGWLPLKAVLPMPRGGVRLLAGPLAPVDVFKVLVGPEFFWDEADGAAPPPWDGIFTDDLFCLIVGGRGWNLRTLGQWRALDENSGFLASSDVPWWRSSRYSQWGRSATCACNSLTDISWKFSVESPSPHGDWRAALWSYRL